MAWISNQFFRCFILLTLFFVLLCPLDKTHLAANEIKTPIILKYLHTKEVSLIPSQKKLIIITIHSDRTRIDFDKARSLIIDYQQGIVLRQGPGKKATQQYALNPVGFDNSNPKEFPALIEAALASFRSIDRSIEDTVQIKEIWFGYELSRMRIAAPITQSHYGKIFGERLLRCQVSRDVDQFDVLVRIAEKRQSMVDANPLLLQLDPVNLIPVLEGLPVRVWENKNDEIHTYVLQQNGGILEK